MYYILHIHEQIFSFAYIINLANLSIYSFFTNQCNIIPAYSSVVAVKQKYISLWPKKIY